MKFKTIFAFVTGASVGSAITAVEIGKVILKNDICKTAIAEIVNRRIDASLFGDKTPEYKFVKTKREKVNYSHRFNNKTSTLSEEKSVIKSFFETREEAESFVKTLNELIDLYGHVTVADYADLIGVDHSIEDVHFGWTNKESFEIRKNNNDVPRNNGYIVTLAKAKRFRWD